MTIARTDIDPNLLHELRKALQDARLTLQAAYDGEAFAIRLRPSVMRRQFREIDALLRRLSYLDLLPPEIES